MKWVVFLEAKEKLPTEKIKRIAEMKCSAVVDRVRRRTGRIGTTVKGYVNDSNASRVRNYQVQKLREKIIVRKLIIFLKVTKCSERQRKGHVLPQNKTYCQNEMQQAS